MHCNRFFRSLLPVILLSLSAGTFAQAPAKPVRWIVSFPPGGLADVLARLVCRHRAGMISFQSGRRQAPPNHQGDHPS